MPGASDVEEKLLRVLDYEADRLLIAAKAGPLNRADAMNLSYYLRAATDASKAELARMEATDPEKLSDKLIGKMLAAAGYKEDGSPKAPTKKAQRPDG